MAWIISSTLSGCAGAFQNGVDRARALAALSFFFRPVAGVVQVLQYAVADEIDFLGRNAVLRRGRTGKFRVPGIAVNIDALDQRLFGPSLRFAVRGGVGAAAFVSAAGIEAEANQIIRGLGFENDWINAGFEGARIFGTQSASAIGFTADSGGIELGDIEMVAQEIAGAAAIGGAGRGREADQAGAVVMEIAVLGGRTTCRPVGMMEAGADHAGFFAGPNDFIDGPGALGQGDVHGGLDVAAGRLVLLRTERGHVFLVHGRDAGEALRFLDRAP